jgi:hypothetical protein
MLSNRRFSWRLVTWRFGSVNAAIRVVAVLLLLSLPAVAEQQGFESELLDHMAGNWVVSGTIGGNEVTHDLVAGWVLGHQYLRFHEVAREVDNEGVPAYEAIVFIGWNESIRRYTCLWLDVTGSGARFPEGTGYAKPAIDELAFVFDTGDDSVIHTTFAYDRESDIWHWLIEIDRGAKRSTFARLSMTRQ